MTSIIDVYLYSDNHMFQYFITIVPTKLNTYQIAADTHQYSVTERVRVCVCVGMRVCWLVGLYVAVCLYACGFLCIPVFMLSPTSVCGAGEAHQPRRRQPWCVWDLHEV